MSVGTPNVIVSPEKFQVIPKVNEDCTLELTNVGFEAVLYRLLTTAPKRYVVKNTKGVIRGNSTAKVTVMLSRPHLRDGVAPGATSIKDDFRLEYALLGEKDVVEPHFANVPQLIKDKKAANRASVLKKMIRCQVILDGGVDGAEGKPAAQGSDGAANSPGGASVGRGMTPAEVAQGTLEEKNRRQESKPALATSSTQLTTRGLVVIGAVVVALLGMWWMMD